MNSSLLKWFLPLLFAATTVVQAAEKEKLTLNRAFALALQLNEDEQIRREELDIAESRYRQALANYFPQLSLFYTKQYRDRLERERTRTSDPTSLVAQQRALDNGTYYYQYSGSNETAAQRNPDQAGISLTWPIFSGFRTYHESAARHEERIGKERLNERARELLFRDVAEIFHQTLQYEAADRIYADEERALRSRIQESARMFAIGRVPQGDLLVARSDLASSMVEAEANRALLQASKELLAFLIGRPASEWQPIDEQAVPPAEALEAYLERIEERKDMVAALQSIRSARSRLEVSRGGHYPDVALDGAYLLQQRPNTGRDWNVTLRVTLPLFQGGQTSEVVRESKANLHISELQLNRLRRLASYEIRQAYSDYISSASRLVLLRENTETARLAFAVQQRDYGLGIVTNLDVLNSLRRYHQARLSLVRTEALLKISQLRLHVAAGIGEPENPNESEDREKTRP